MNYDVDYFIAKFSKVHLIAGHFKRNGESCALGACGYGPHGEDPANSDEANALMNLFSKYLIAPTYSEKEKGVIKATKEEKRRHLVTRLNDGADFRYPQKTAQERILAALHDIKKMQTPKREKVKPEIASDLLTFPIQERLDTILSQIKSN